MRAPALLLAACGLLYFSGLGAVPFHTRGEPREALVAREILRSGEWVVPTRPDGELTRKPPIFYWAAASFLSVLPDRPELAVRLPSALLATAAVLGTWAAVRAGLGPAIALPAALILATSVEWIRAATIARVDMALVAGTTLLFGAWLLALARARPEPGAGLLAAATAGAALATLAKGPVALVLPALAVTALAAARRDPSLFRRLGALRVLGLGAAVAALWYGAAFARHGWAFFDVVARENWLRFVDSEDAGTGHSGHGIFYLPLLALVGFLPWTPLLPLAAAPLADRSRRTTVVTFAAAWVAVILVFFSLSDAKRSVYLLPLFPALSLLLGLGVQDPPAGRLGLVARVTAALYAPAFAVLAAGALSLASGADVVALVRPLLTPRDAQDSLAIVSVARGAAPVLAGLAVVAGGAVVLVVRARGAADGRRLVAVVAAVTVVWTVAIGVWLRPPIARAASLRPFMMQLDGLLPPDATLHALGHPDAGLRFYAPRPLAEWRAAHRGPAYLLLWEDERQRWRGEDGRPLEPLAVSEARQSRRGPLTLLLVPAGATLRPGPPR